MTRMAKIMSWKINEILYFVFKSCKHWKNVQSRTCTCFKNSTHLVIQTSSLTLNSRAISMALICNLLDTVYAIFVRQAYDMWTTIPKNGGREIFQKAGKFETHCRPQKIPSCTVQWPSWILCTPSHPTLSTSILNPVAPPLRVFCPTMYLFLTFFLHSSFAYYMSPPS